MSAEAMSVGRGRHSQHEAMAAVMTRILAAASPTPTTGTATMTCQDGRGRKRVERMGNVESKIKRKRRKIKVFNLTMRVAFH